MLLGTYLGKDTLDSVEAFARSRLLLLQWTPWTPSTTPKQVPLMIPTKSEATCQFPTLIYVLWNVNEGPLRLDSSEGVTCRRYAAWRLGAADSFMRSIGSKCKI